MSFVTISNLSLYLSPKRMFNENVPLLINNVCVYIILYIYIIQVLIMFIKINKFYKKKKRCLRFVNKI